MLTVLNRHLASLSVRMCLYLARCPSVFVYCLSICLSVSVSQLVSRSVSHAVIILAYRQRAADTERTDDNSRHRGQARGIRFRGGLPFAVTTRVLDYRGHSK